MSISELMYMADGEVSNVEIFPPESRRKSGPLSHRPFSVYTRLLRNRSENIINRIFSAKRSKSKPQHINPSSAELSKPNCISVGIQTIQGDIENTNWDHITPGNVISDTSQRNAFKELFWDESEQTTDLEYGLNEIILNGVDFSDAIDYDAEVEDDAISDDEALIDIKRPESEIPKLSPIINSLFPEIPPVIRFVKDNEEVIPMPKSVLRKLIWRNSPITPNVLKRALSRSHFKLINRPGMRWIGYFGRQISSPLFRQLREYQKFNHIPGSFELGRKDQLTKNLNLMRNRVCGEAYKFYPTTFLLPHEYFRLKTAFRLSISNRNETNGIWIVKPPASARGRGIYLASKFTDIPTRKKVVVQRYISNPFLINGNKFDLRIYVYVTSVDPLRIYVHRNGLVRFATRKYSVSQEAVGNRFVHLTNFSINKKNALYWPEDEPHDNFSHKWSLDELWRYLKAQGHDTEKIWEEIKAIAFKTTATATFKMASMVAQHVTCRESVHEMFGFDIILDSRLRPWLLEVNISPSLHTSTKIDNDIKSEVLVDLLNIAGFRLPPAEDKMSIRRVQSSRRDSCEIRRQSEMTFRPRMSIGDMGTEDQNLPFHKVQQLRYNLTSAEKAKHRLFSTRMQSPADIQTIMDEPTTDDVLMLTTTVNEWYRASLGRFERIYPQRSPEAAKMLRLIQVECDRLTQSRENFRYYDALIYEFLQRFGMDENSALVEGNSHLDYSRELGGQDLRNLSSTLRISIKGLVCLAKLSEKRLSADLMRSDSYRPPPFPKLSRPSGAKRFSKSSERSSNSSNSSQEPPSIHSVGRYKVFNQHPSKRKSRRKNSTNSVHSKRDASHVKNSRPRSTIPYTWELSLD